MASGQNKVIKLFGPWRGIMERPGECTDQHVEDAFNFAFDGNEIRQVPGNQTQYVKTDVDAVITSALGEAAYLDHTAKLGDGSTSTEVTGLWGTPTARLYVGFPTPFSFLTWTLGATPQNVANTLPITKYWNGTAWTTLTVSRTTNTGNKEFTQSGTWNWTEPTDWLEGNGDLTAAQADQGLYWLRIDTGAANMGPANFGISGLTSRIDEDQGTIPTNGLYEYVRPSGERQLLIGKDRNDASYSLATVMRYDASFNRLVPLPMPRGGKQTRPGCAWVFAPYGRNLIATNGEGPLLRYDGERTSTLEAVAGKDKDSRAYLGSTPRGKFLIIYRERLFVAGGRENPNTVFFSEYSNASNIIPADDTAPAGGANVWPARNNFDVGSNEGDEITGMAVILDRLVIFTRRSIHVYDDNSLQAMEKNVGCTAPRSIANAGDRIFFKAKDGVYAFNGVRAEKVSHAIERTLTEGLNSGADDRAVGVYVPSKHQYRLAVATTGSSLNTLVLVYSIADPNRPWWSKYGSAPANVLTGLSVGAIRDYTCLAAASDPGGGCLLSGDSYYGGIFIEDHGRPNIAFLAMKRLGFEDEGVRTWRNWRVLAGATGAPIETYALGDGRSYTENLSSIFTSGSALSPTFRVDTRAALQPTLATNNTWSSSALAFPGGGGLGLRYLQFRVPFGLRSRQLQPFIFNHGFVTSIDQRVARLVIRGIEVEWRSREGRR